MKPLQSAYDVAHGLGLPAEYVQFLTTLNGGKCRQDRIVRLSNGTEVLCDCLFGFVLQPGLDFQFWQKEFADDLPKDCVVMGSGPGGEFFLLMKEYGAWKLIFLRARSLGNLQKFRRKCAYALARIGTDESRAAFQEMASSSDVGCESMVKRGYATGQCRTNIDDCIGAIAGSRRAG